MPEHITDSRPVGSTYTMFCTCRYESAGWPNVFKSKSAEREHVARHTGGKVTAR